MHYLDGAWVYIKLFGQKSHHVVGGTTCAGHCGDADAQLRALGFEDGIFLRFRRAQDVQHQRVCFPPEKGFAWRRDVFHAISSVLACLETRQAAQRQLQSFVFLGVAKAHHTLVKAIGVKGGEGNGGHANFGGEPFAEVGFAQVFLWHA